MIIGILIVLGLCFGSFVNALIWRLHKQDTSKQKTDRYSIVHGRSMCTSCGHTLHPKDLIPVLSWVSLRGRCRYCHARIQDNPLPEILLPLLFIVSYLYWPLKLNAQGITLLCFWLVILIGLLALLLYDVRWYILPNRVIFPLLTLAITQTLLRVVVFHGGLAVLASTLWGFLIGGGIFWVLFQVSGGNWIGGGDVKLGWLLGLLVGGPAASVLLIFIASLLGSIVATPLLLSGRAKRKTHLPFGPFLIMAAFIVQLFGVALISWYRRQIGL